MVFLWVFFGILFITFLGLFSYHLNTYSKRRKEIEKKEKVLQNTNSIMYPYGSDSNDNRGDS